MPNLLTADRKRQKGLACTKFDLTPPLDRFVAADHGSRRSGSRTPVAERHLQLQRRALRPSSAVRPPRCAPALQAGVRCASSVAMSLGGQPGPGRGDAVGAAAFAIGSPTTFPGGICGAIGARRALGCLRLGRGSVGFRSRGCVFYWAGEQARNFIEPGDREVEQASWALE